jgi:hypothetical protein
VGDCTLLDPCALLHVTSRRKLPPRRKSLPQVAISTLHSLELEFWLSTC